MIWNHLCILEEFKFASINNQAFRAGTIFGSSSSRVASASSKNDGSERCLSLKQEFAMATLQMIPALPLNIFIEQKQIKSFTNLKSLLHKKSLGRLKKKYLFVLQITNFDGEAINLFRARAWKSP